MKAADLPRRVVDSLKKWRCQETHDGRTEVFSYRDSLEGKGAEFLSLPNGPCFLMNFMDEESRRAVTVRSWKLTEDGLVLLVLYVFKYLEDSEVSECSRLAVCSKYPGHDFYVCTWDIEGHFDPLKAQAAVEDV